MKIIGSRGFKWFDLVGVFLFLLILGSLFFLFIRKAEYATIVLRVSEADYLGRGGLPMWYLENFKPGMEQKDIFKRSTISVLKTYSYPDNEEYRVMYLTMKLLTTYDKRSGVYSFEGIPLLVGSYQTFKFNGILLRGVIHRIENVDFVREEKILEVDGFVNPAKISNQDPYVAETMTDGVKNYLANKIKKGLQIKDSDGSVVAEVVDVVTLPSVRKFIYNDRLVGVVDDDRKKVNLKMRIKVRKYGDIYMFREDMPVMVNTDLWLNFWDFSVSFTVTDVRGI